MANVITVRDLANDRGYGSTIEECRKSIDIYVLYIKVNRRKMTTSGQAKHMYIYFEDRSWVMEREG